ncbi:predicted protein [Histoplasma capsulatum var. duboisii H88]|uniref:Predicted protein n=2 Tax=Ajellomyces capsulatus TaxID=5037 RepID=F0UPG8_AJEC8|nr:predicted protein [Histoplasma capsulatum H143]EGC47767.1 predicted protein [Histoplasma capsulatum var. duboisii H88]
MELPRLQALVTEIPCVVGHVAPTKGRRENVMERDDRKRRIKTVGGSTAMCSTIEMHSIFWCLGPRIPEISPSFFPMSRTPNIDKMRNRSRFAGMENTTEIKLSLMERRQLQKWPA